MAAVVLALFAGMLTILAPCTLPVLPGLLGASLGRSDKARPAFITLGFVVSFAAAAAFLVSPLKWPASTRWRCAPRPLSCWLRSAR
jgi:cytochrome c biogenesis protein CcdA